MKICAALALVLGSLFLSRAASADDPQPAAQPAVPGGGNPNAASSHAATPALPAPAGDDATADDLDDAARGGVLARHPELGAEAKARWDAMTPEQKRDFLRDHPRLKRAMLAKAWDRMTPAERGAFCENHPELRPRLRERWQAMTPDQRREFLRAHPWVARAARARRARSDQGVRDHGAGEGRGGVGQGAEHPAPSPAAGRVPRRPRGSR